MLGCSAAAQDPGTRLIGTVRVVDGDTIRLGGATVRLFGIDAPEADQRCGGNGAPAWACGAWVVRQVQARFEGAQAECAVLETDRYGRSVARCKVDGQDMGQTLVAQGLAFAFLRYSTDYAEAEKQALFAGAGLHGAGVQTPDEYRRAQARGRAAASLVRAPQGCVIKGNIGAGGRRIYHLPGQDWYDRTVIRTDQGERWFCSEAEAQGAGWRRARK